MKQFHCGDVVPGCQQSFRSEEESVILSQVAEHARRDHGMSVIPDGLVNQVISHIREVPAA